MIAENILGTAFGALLNSLWQGAAIALLTWATLRFLPRVNAATRCAVWWTVLAAVVLLPFAPQPDKYAASSPIALSEALPVPVTAASVPQAPMPIETSAPSRLAGPLQFNAGAGLLALFAIWATISLFRIGQIVRSYRYLRGIKQRSRPVSPEQLVNFNYWLLACGIDRTARLLISSEIVSPMAVGFRRPAVIVPETLMGEFTTEELDHVLLHELAHIARYDDWTNLFARLIGALLPVHPVAVWLVKRIEQEREVACDDWVVAMTGQARPYAASLTRLFELCSARRRQLLATGMADRASHLGERIEALLRSGRDFAPRVSLVRVAMGIAILGCLVLVGAQAPQWVIFAQEPAFAQAPDVPPVPPVAPVAPVPPTSPSPAPPAAAPAPPRAPEALEPPEAPERPLKELRQEVELQQEFQARQQELRAELEQLRDAQRQFAEQSRRYSPDHPEMRNLSNEIRALEARLQARKAETRGIQAQLQTQQQAQLQAQQQVQQAQLQVQQAQAQLQAEQANRGSNNSFLAALVAAGYGNLSVDEIIEMRNSGLSPEFLRAVAETGWGKLSPKELITLAHSGVSSNYLRALRDAGFKSLSVSEVIEMANSGVRPDFIRTLKDSFPQVTLREVIDAAHNGLNARDLRQAREYGPNLTLPQILRLKQAGVI